ncbi:uncharacterized protein LOC119390195 [Rhipicephalus sanguineus]|uniref:uncharacterized protein LOC119390195 n=1 Tax=Rhipicephalus sanguineus TaxID=34632 RepID=UPI0020C3CBD2|nr:uncharacterized protein LOC119390195 [Rhipicephalus sanguineus]
MTTTGAKPASMPPSSERYMPADTSKRNSITQERDLQRKERSFQECLAFLMPVYLLPFVIGDRPHVLMAFLLFAIAILGDETTVFFRLCLYALQRYALRMQPLFLYLQFLVFALSLLLPSNLIVVFSTVFIDRFVTTVHNEIVGSTDQRSSVRIQTSSTLNYFDEGRRPRWGRRSSITALGRRARSVSMVSDTTAASEASAGSSVIRQYRMHPASPTLEAPDTSPSDWKMPKGARKTSFSGFDQYEGDEPCHLPVRRIRSFSVEPNQPSSILKRSPAPPPPPSSPLASQDMKPWTVGITGGIEGRRDTLPMGEFWMQMQEAALFATPTSSRDWHDDASMPRTVPASIAMSSSSSSFSTAQCSAMASPENKRDTIALPADSYAAAVSQQPTSSTSGTWSSPSPGLGKSAASIANPSPSRMRAKRRQQAVSSLSTKTLIQAPMQPAGETRQSRDQQSQSASLTEKKLESQRSPKPKQTATPTSEPKPELKAVEPSATPKCVVVPEKKAEAQLAVAVEQQQQQDTETKQEVRGVLKKRNTSLQPSLGSRRGSVLARKSLLPQASVDSLVAPQTPLIDSKAPVDKVSSIYYTGAEQQTSSLKVRALTASARPAFIAGAAYTAIFGNLVNFNTLTTRKTLLAILDCQDDECPVNFWSWLAVSLPVALICCVTSWMTIYCASLVSCDDDINEQIHDDMSKSARIRHRDLKRHTMWEAVVFYWIVGIPAASCAYGIRHPDEYIEGPLLGLTLLGLSVSPAYSLRSCWTHRMLCWRQLCSRMPWNIILMLGSVAALTRTIEDFQLVEMGLSKLDDNFWSQRSTKSCQFILVSVAAILSEIVLGDSLARSMATTVLRVALVTETPVSFYVVPVSLAASINVMLPVSLPLLVMREYLHTKCAQMVAYGVFFKCTALVAIFLLMNTVGLFVFQSDTLPGRRMSLALNNASHDDIDFL